MTEPLTPPSDPFEPSATSPEEPATPIQPAAAQPIQPPQAAETPGHAAQAPQAVQPQAGLPQAGQPPAGQPQFSGQAPYAGAPAYPGQPQYPGQPTYQPGHAPVPPGMPVSGAPTSGFPGQPTSGVPTSGFPGQTGYPQTTPQGYPAYGQPGFPAAGYPAPVPPKKSKAPMIIGIVLGVLLLVCGGGGVGIFLFFKNNVDPLGKGYESPKTAANAFLNAFYTDKDVTKAEETVCKAARDKKVITAQIEKIAGYDTTYRSPKFSWETTVSEETKESATVGVKLTMSTSDEKVSSQDLKLTVVNSDGWRVCEVQG